MKLALEELGEGVETHTINEIQLRIADDVVPYTAKSILDFRKDAYGEGFVLGSSDENCGCC